MADRPSYAGRQSRTGAIYSLPLPPWSASTAPSRSRASSQRSSPTGLASNCETGPRQDDRVPLRDMVKGPHSAFGGRGLYSGRPPKPREAKAPLTHGGRAKLVRTMRPGTPHEFGGRSRVNNEGPELRETQSTDA